jgi:hypothetical protein
MVSLRRATAADEYRTMRWRTASPYGEAARRRILSLSVRVLGLPGQEPNLNLVSASNIDVANANKLIIASVVATIATCARGHEIEFFIRQFDRVSESGHVLHVGLLSVFDVSGGIAVTAATLSLAARRQSGCTVAQIFFEARAGRSFILLPRYPGKRLPSCTPLTFADSMLCIDAFL